MTEYSLAMAMKSIAVEVEIKMRIHNHRIRGQLVGHREGEYLMVDVPRKYNWIQVQEWFNESTSVVLRGVSGNGLAFAAVSRFIGLSPRPVRQLYLTAPDKFEERSLRKVPRIQVDIESRLAIARELPRPPGMPASFEGISGRITDLSRTGIAFESNFSLEFARELFVNQLVDVSVSSGSILEGSIPEGTGKQINFIAEVKSCREVTDGLLQFGLAVDTRNQDYVNGLGELILSSRHIQAVLKGE